MTASRPQLAFGNIFSDAPFVTKLQKQLREHSLYKQTDSGKPLSDDGIAGVWTKKALQKWAGLKGVLWMAI